MSGALQEVQLITPAGRRLVVGFVRDNVFYKRVREEDHLYVLLDAWGIDAGVFDKVVMSCQEIRILDETTGKVYSCHPRLWRNQGVTKEHKPHGKQIFLSRDNFVVTERPKSDKEILAEALAKRREARKNV